MFSSISNKEMQNKLRSNFSSLQDSYHSSFFTILFYNCLSHFFKILPFLTNIQYHLLCNNLLYLYSYSIYSKQIHIHILIISKFLLMTGEISLNYFSVLLLTILTLISIPTVSSIECEPTHLEFFSNYSLGKRD